MSLKTSTLVLQKHLLQINHLNSNIMLKKITAQTHQKYWHYRQRLISDFLVEGLANYSANQPFDYTKDQTRHYGGYGLSIPSGNRYNNGNSYIPTNSYQWGDGSSNLGWYIAVLATELRLLYNNNQDYSGTQQELYYAVKAYQRLDANCEAIAYDEPGYFW